MIAFLIGVFVLWIVWRCLTRSTHVVEIAPPAPTTINVLTPPIVTHTCTLLPPLRLFGWARLYGLREQIIGAE
jgi:hypothetical protein